MDGFDVSEEFIRRMNRFIPFIMAIFYLGAFFLVYLILTPIESYAAANNCLQDQYLKTNELTCRNCSDLNQIFLGYQDWLGRETTNDLRRQDDTKKNMLTLLIDRDQEEDQYRPKSSRLRQQAVTQQQQQNRAQKQRFKDGPSEELLSRLISASGDETGGDSSSESGDQEFIDSTTTSQDQTGDTGLMSDESGFSGDGNLISSSNGDVFTVQSASKRTQRLIHHLISYSPLIEKELLQAIDQCRQNQNVSACQMWSNLCVLTMYSHSDPATARYNHYHQSNNNNKRSSYLANNLQSDAESVGGRFGKQSWQKCSQFTSESICNSWRDWFRFERKSGQADSANIFAQADEQLVTKLGSTGPLLKLNQVIKLLAYKYSFDGKFIGVEQFGLSEMSRFCPFGVGNFHGDRSSSSPMDSIRLGKNMELRCKFNSNLLFGGLVKQLNGTIFIDLYLAYQQNGAMFVKPVPVLIKNLMLNGWQINRQHSEDPTRWKLVHRFFFHSLIKLDAEQDHEIAMYAQNVVLDFKFKKQDKGALMSQLLLTLDYEISVARHPQQSNATSSSADLARQQQSPTIDSGSVITNILIVQTLVDMLSYKKDLDLAITILAILSSVWSLIKCYNVQKCYGLVKMDLDSLIKFTLIASDTIGNLLALVTFAFLAFLFAALKLQSSQVQVLAPTEEISGALILNLQLALLLKFIGLLYKLYMLLTVDIFFIDWEKPKMLTTSEMVNHHAAYTYASKNETKQTAQTDSRLPIGASQTHQSASFWRPYTIINKWLQMQTLRRQNFTLQMILFVCLVDYFQLTKLATEDTDFTMVSGKVSEQQSATTMMNFPELSSTVNRSFRILILAFVYLLLSLSQMLYKKYLHEPFIRSSVHEFVDLCSVANVSLFAMLHPRFGYYIHGRNANGTGDCGIAEMNALLEREERDLCTKRGLAPNSDQQTFNLVLPKIINDHYRKLLFGNEFSAGFQQKSSFVNESMFPFGQSANKGLNGLRTAMSSTFASKSSFSSNRTLIETIVAKNKAVNLFLTNFLEHIYKDIDYSIRERRRFESLLWDVDFDEESFAAGAGCGPGMANIGSATGRDVVGGPLAAMGQYGGDRTPAASFCVDSSYSFTSLLLFGLEIDLTLVELLSLLAVDLWLGEPPLIITVALIWLLHKTFKIFYVSCARRNLVAKAALDEKFLFKR